MKKNGIIYIVTKSFKHLNEVIFSARSLRKKSPHLSICLFTDLDVKEKKAKIFDQIIKVDANEHPLKLKVKLLLDSPFENTLFLDSDTEVMKDISPIFATLENSDFAICNAPDIEPSYPQDHPAFFRGYKKDSSFNTGVFLYNKSPLTKKMMKDWYLAVSSQDDEKMSPGNYCDQYYFNELFPDFYQENQTRVSILDNCIWNSRASVLKHMKADSLVDNIAIYHGRPPLSVLKLQDKSPLIFYIRKVIIKLSHEIPKRVKSVVQR